MPPRGARKAAGIETNKRELGDDHELLSTRRQSKRIKSAEQLRSTPSSPQPKSRRVQVKREARYLQEETTKAENPTLLNTEELTEVKSEVSVKVNEEEIKEQTSATKATRKRRSTKKEEAEMTPLRVRTQGLRMFVGAHVSAAGGVFNAVNNSKHVGGNAFALFLKSQRKWDNPPLQDEHRDNFVKLCKEHDYDAAKYVLPHGSYLVNLAQEDEAKAKQAYDAFLDDLRRCEALGIRLYNFHPGSTNKTPLSSALARLAKALTNALAATSNVVPVLETMCGHGSTIGGSLSEFRDLLALIPKEYHSRIGVCIDTCHSFAAGYDLVSPAGFQAFLKEFEDLIGIQHLRALHLNDSKAPGGSKRDLHANIGTGFLGLRAFHNVMNEPRFEGLPMILETPIDRIPAAATNRAKQEAAEEDVESGASDDEIKPKTKKKQQKKPAAAKAVPDYSIWAREIALLESLIGMDPESDEFRALEAELSEEGRETREKHMEQYLRKQETEEKKKAKSGGKQKTLIGMMNGSKGRGKSTTKKGYETESEDEGCQSC
ncbi:DNA-(apurinic or apyrimidinic site) lyase APN1 [Aspergillus nidulans FGSC A4]|uniref:Apurinic-apyrimidinic endonuclease 1 n=1 Tax=Emericella nidulans (strain FGSC A4 / ATCC 38163 / CBS 112.46 / NRRL 194 / M139) TaxID=227321 RepID=C8V628_EMENI|nr:DNA-(apurinic or apyrimidinic site) lyase APN1 [Aspergillus nidulans FGSC A4]CBF75032.1 TPA: major apurinic/apyrimidinic endonuclease (Eurofung) [Aspergillus nidulans FGSC A4]